MAIRIGAVEHVQRRIEERAENEQARESDESLAARSATEAAAFAELYARYAASILSYCRFRIRSQVVAEDAASEVFVKALASLQRQPVKHVRPWLFSIAHNVVADRFRRPQSELSLDEALLIASSTPSPESLAEEQETADRLRVAIASLSPDQARVLELRLSGLDGPEIRQVLNRSRSWVDTTQYRALIQLRRVLAAGRQEES